MSAHKRCIFCNGPPTKKNKEHVLAQWLLRLTGDPARTVYLGRDWSDPDLPQRAFSFTSFTFPACTSCNTTFGKLEGRVGNIIRTMLASGLLGAQDISLLLDWLDKVRVGLWLGLMYLNGNHRGITPGFGIAQRVAAHDRLVCIYREARKSEGISIAGCESPLFQDMPSCFVLSINDLHLFSASAPSLFSARLGLPFPIGRELSLERDAGYFAEIVPGSEQIALPLVPFPVKDGGTMFFQPTISRMADEAGQAVVQAAFETEYARQLIPDPARRQGKILQLTDFGIRTYPDQPCEDWLPRGVFSKFELMADLGVTSGAWLEALYRDSMSVSREHLDDELRAHLKACNEGALRLRERIMSHFVQQVRNSDRVLWFNPNR